MIACLLFSESLPVMVEQSNESKPYLVCVGKQSHRLMLTG
jgi:hypothetical protein